MAFDDDGYTIVDAVLSPEQCDEVIERVAAIRDVRAGSRNVLDHPWCRDLALCLKRHAAIAEHLPTAAVAVQCTLFDKSPTGNWLVAPHQDLSVPVREHVSHPEYRGWSEKEGVLFVQPPRSVLESLVAVRVHLDDALLMRPLLVHASSKATAPAQRRVLHFLFGPAHLPDGLRWNRAV